MLKFCLIHSRPLTVHRSTYPFPKQALVFICLRYKSSENSMGKGEIARNKQFLLFLQHFLAFQVMFTILVKSEIVVCN